MIYTKINFLFISCLVAITLFTQCRKEEVDVVDCSGITPTYSSNIKSILDANCATAGCHNSASKKSGYDLSTYETSKTAAGNKEFVGSIQHKKGYTKMPKSASKLSETNIQLITCWVQNGMPL